MNKRTYSNKEYSSTYHSLNNGQREFLDKFVKRGYRTKWLYIFASNKGLVLDKVTIEDRNELDDLEKLKELNMEIDWELIDYKDHYEINRDVRCECGRPLRHEYTVAHIPTNKSHTLGIDHLTQFTNINKEDAKEIVKNFRRIDLEKKEILKKVIEKRDMYIDKNINKDFIYPSDILEHIVLGLPLLDRQINRLKRLGAFSNYEKEFKNNEFLKTGVKETIGFHLDTKNKSTEGTNINIAIIPEFKVEYSKMINILKSHGFSIDEAEKHIISLTYYENTIDPLSIDKEEMTMVFRKVLGQTSIGKLRNLLIDIEALLKRIHGRQYRK